MTMRKRFSRPLYLTMALTGLALVAGCGDNDASTTEEEHEAAATPQTALVEIGRVRAGLAGGLAAYREGDAEKADQLVGDAYLEHFELVEGPLEERDEELNEELEELIRTEIREEIKEAAKVSRIAAMVAEANRELDEAERALEG
jgi:DNA anti-recombination protein RmuC